jgi:nucleoside phosphorylase
VVLPRIPGDGRSLAPPRIHFGPIFSGDKVVASEHALDNLLALRLDALGVEMEGAGVALAAKHASKPFLMVRGVADYADDKKSTDHLRWAPEACESVARFVAALLASWAQSTKAKE